MRDIGDVVIIGGGAAGCAVAYYLGQAGVKATLIEREGIGMQASGYSAGGVNPLHGLAASMRPLAMASFTLHLALWDELLPGAHYLHDQGSFERSGLAGVARGARHYCRDTRILRPLVGPRCPAHAGTQADT